MIFGLQHAILTVVQTERVTFTNFSTLKTSLWFWSTMLRTAGLLNHFRGSGVSLQSDVNVCFDFIDYWYKVRFWV